MSDILAATALEQIAALEARKISAVELLSLSMARGDEVHGALNAVVASDPERALAAAHASDTARARGEAQGLLAGLPMTVKDTFDVDGMCASGGVVDYTGRECEDAVMVARAKAEGAVIWGKTNTPVLAGDWQSYNRLYGTTNNPWDLARTPGGSSGGSAAVLAAQVTALEMGSDIAGSLRVPAAFCGVTAHKPTYGLLPKRGHVPPAPGTLSEADLSVVGPMARTARDLSLLMHVMSAGATPKAPARLAPKGLKVGLWLDDPAMLLDAPVRSAVEAWAGRLAAAGFEVRPLASPVDPRTLLLTYNLLLMTQIAARFPDAAREAMLADRASALAELEAGADPLSRASNIVGSTASHREWLFAHETRHQLMAQMAAVFETVDVIVCPVTPVEPFPHDHSRFVDRRLTLSSGESVLYDSMKTWIALATALYLPSTAIPAGLSANGLPIGVQVIGPHGDDARCLAAAAAFEDAVGAFVAPG